MRFVKCIILFLIILLTALHITIVVFVKNQEPESELEGYTPLVTQTNTSSINSSERVEILRYVSEINQKTSRIKSFYSKKVRYHIWRNGPKITLHGTIALEKPLYFRMKIESIFGDELDLGSNNKVFWYWSRRDKSPYLYYASHDDYKKTRLKAVFNPEFIRKSFGIFRVDDNFDYFLQDKKNIILFYRYKVAYNQKTIYVVFISKNDNQVSGSMLLDDNGNPLALCEIKERNSVGVPNKILYVWYQENKVMLVELHELLINNNIDKKLWLVPDKPKINMAEE